jgi:energy-converting hydrogenase Eha subunit B
VGIVVGRGEDGGLLVLHCSYSLGGVVCSPDAKAAGFTDLGRPSLFEKAP